MLDAEEGVRRVVQVCLLHSLEVLVGREISVGVVMFTAFLAESFWALAPPVSAV